MDNQRDPYGPIQTAEDLGHLLRAHRKHKKLTLEKASGLANLSVRFLSEFERGKETAEIGKVLKALRTLGLDIVVQPRSRQHTNPDTENPFNAKSNPSDTE